MEPVRKKSYIMDTHVYKHLMKKYFKSPVLDLGSGKFFEKNVDYAIDLYDSSADGKCNFIKHDLDVKPYPLNKKFKTITCFRVVCILKNPKIMVEEAYRLLGNEGVFIINACIDREGWNNGVVNNSYPTKYNGLTEKKLTHMLTNQGFKIIGKYYNSILI